MRILDSRRLTGTNLQSVGPCAVAEVAFDEGEVPEEAISTWRAALERLAPRFDLDLGKPFWRRYRDGASIGFTAPIDALYTATEINEYAIKYAAGRAEIALEDAVDRLRQSASQEANAPMRSLQVAAAQRDYPFLWDDDEVSIGFGAYAQVFEAGSVPKVSEIEWRGAGTIPVAMITGTNGKTTTSRMLTRILKTADYSVGSTSTDGVCVNEEVVEAGDWTGTGAARMVLRRNDISAAVLETARGGLLRRGLAIEACDVVVVTNVAADHLGDYGIDDVSAMAEVKNLICAAANPRGQRIINADDRHLMRLVNRYDTPLVLFSLVDDNPAVVDHCARGGEAWFVRNGSLVHRRLRQDQEVVAADQIPCTFDGAARHNISNALAAAAAAYALGVGYSVIAQALEGFGAKPGDNPGRCQLFSVGDVRVMLDFGHNAHGLEAILNLAKGLMQQHPESRVCVSLGQAGDRQDDEIYALADTLAAMNTDHVILREMAGYERGRGVQEVASMIKHRLHEHDFADDQVLIVDGEINALDAAMTWARPGDLIMLLVHLERKAVRQWVETQQAMQTN
jgi:cyanophycin synthetase